jgi:hypothetical protein
LAVSFLSPPQPENTEQSTAAHATAKAAFFNLFMTILLAFHRK